jgi:hypothetical protein
VLKKAKSGRKNRSVAGKRVTGPDVRGVSAQKCAPLLPSWRLCANRPHGLLNGALAHVDAQFQEFTPYAFSTKDADCSSPSRLLKASISAATFGVGEAVLDLRFQDKRKSSRCQPEQCLWLHDEERVFPGPNYSCQEHEEQAIGFRAGGPFHLPSEDDQRLSQEGLFGDELGLASVKIGEGCQRQGGQERFGPPSKTRGECMQAAILQPPERGHHTSQTTSFSIP